MNAHQEKRSLTIERRHLKVRGGTCDRCAGTYTNIILAALLGIPTPFCSCSAVALFIGFVESGFPLGITFSFLVASPLINEITASRFRVSACSIWSSLPDVFIARTSLPYPCSPIYR
jgi:uncharacterized membrane protein YraQ (UPF0718 family)